MAIMTRWLMPPESWCGKAASRRSGVGDADLRAAARRARSRALAAVEAEMRLQRLADLEADGEAGVEARHRLLEDHRHVLADDLPPLGAALSASRSRAVEGAGGRR